MGLFLGLALGQDASRETPRNDTSFNLHHACHDIGSSLSLVRIVLMEKATKS